MNKIQRGLFRPWLCLALVVWVVPAMLQAGAGTANQSGGEPGGTETAPIPRETWLLARPTRHYTIQVFADGTEASVLRLIRKEKLYGRVAYFRSVRAGKPWYSLVYGYYVNLEQAKTALRDLPKSLQEQMPWIRPFGGIHAAIRMSGTGRNAVAADSASGRAAVRKPRPARGVGQKRQLAAGQAAFNAGKYAEALRLWRPLAELGQPAAQYNLGFIYESGWGAKRDYDQAAKWYRLAAGQGHAKAQFNLGMLYVNGLGVARGLGGGLEWIQRAAQGGHIKAREFLASAYLEGHYGLPQDVEQAAYWSATGKPLP